MAGKGFGGMAKKWLKAQTDELLTADRGKRESAAYDSDNIEREAKDHAMKEAILTAVPGLRKMTERADANKAQAAADRDATRIAELAARPHAAVDIAVTGELVDSWSGELPAMVELDDAGDLRVDLTPLDEQAPALSGVAFRGWRFVIPRWTGAGTYDLAAIWRQLEDDASKVTGDDYVSMPDPMDWSFDLDETVYETFYWHVDAGASTIVASGENGRRLKLELAMDSAGGSIVVAAEVNLPPFE
jgi:hypothetical protein